MAVKNYGTRIGRLGQPRTRVQLLRLARRQVGSEIDSAVNPLENESGRLVARRNYATNELGGIYNKLRTTIGESTARAQLRYNEGLNREKAVFAQAQQEMNQIKQEQAMQAQEMAQQIGAPVPVDFAGGVADEQIAGSQAAAGSQLWSMAGLGAQVNEAESFTGKVFPLVELQTRNELRAGFDEDINQIAKEVAQLRGQKGSLTNQRFAELLAAEREWALQRAMANRDWRMANESLALENKQFDLAEGEVTGQYKGKPTLAAQQAAQDNWFAMQDLGMKQQQVGAARREMANQLWEGYFEGGDEVVSYTKYIPVSEARARELEGLGKDVAQMENGQWYQLKNVKEAFNASKLKKSDWSDLNRFFEVLRAWGVGKSIATNIIRKRSGAHKWVYGSGGETGRANKGGGPGNRNT